MKALKKLLLELIPVFLGVILALYFDNINEHRIERGKINGLLKKIELGTEKNLASLDVQISQNKKVVDSLVFYQDSSNIRVGDIIERARGIRYIQFDLAAWNVLKSSELLVDIDYELASLLYLLNESIDKEDMVNTPNNAYDKPSKEEVITDLSDFIGSIQHQRFLSVEILKILQEEN